MIEYDKRNSQDSSQILLSDEEDYQCALGMKSVMSYLHLPFMLETKSQSFIITHPFVIVVK